jgi:hypothetical protein
LAGVLGLFQNADDLCRHLSQQYENGVLEDVKQAVFNALDHKIWEMNIYPEASSSFNYEQEVTQIKVTGFEFELLESPNIIFRPVNFDDNSLIVESKLSVDVNVECSFSFYVYDYIDKDYVGIGGDSVNTQDNLEVEVLITFAGDFKRVGAQVKVDEVEVEMKTRACIDFGHIDPDWGDEDYD